MHVFKNHPLPVLAGLLVVAFGLFLVSGIPRYRDASGGVDLVVGSVAWFGFLALSLLFLVAAVTASVRGLRRRRAA